ncbi:hypothetical protein PC128_g22956 [Phytophthora cactorum]|nr:hypothetical protein PC128_g22956 [Phytophthora cactorum]
MKTKTLSGSPALVMDNNYSLFRPLAKVVTLSRYNVT